MERIQKVIANSGYCSRRKAEELILQGKVKVNGETLNQLGYKVTKKDLIVVEGKTIDVKEDKVYLLLYKPKGCLSSVSDDRGRVCVVDLIEGIEQRIYPIGRLDYDTTGVLLLTNDGEFANLMMHPKYHLPKVYDLTINGLLNAEDIKKLEKGIILEGVKTLPAKIRITNKDLEHKSTSLIFKIYEGKNRQIKRMFDIFGYHVKRLHRVQFGPIVLKGMRPGEYRYLKPQEVKELKSLANGTHVYNQVRKQTNEDYGK